MSNTRNAADISRDEFVEALAALYGTGPRDWDGMTYAEITQELTLEELNRVYSYCSGAEI